MNSEIRTNDSTQDAARVPPVIDADKSVEPEHQDAALAPDDFGSGPSKLNMRFLAFDGQCIPKLGVLVRWPGGSCLSKTDADGCLPPIEARPGAGLKIAVQRFDGSYKEIGGCAMPATDGELTLVSPKIVFEIQTEAHAGAPGDAEKHVPRLDTADHGDLVPARVRAAKENEALASGPPTGTAQPTPANAAAPTPAKPPAKSVIAPAAKAKPVANKPPQHISGRTETKPTIHKGRDANGNPLAVITEKALDWWNSWRLPTFNLWGGAGTADAGKGSAAPATPVAVSDGMKAKVDALLAFAEEQTLYKYDGEGTAAIVAGMAKGTFKHKKPEKGKEPEKRPHISRGECYKYVKVALTRSKIIEGVLAAEFTKDTSVQKCASKAGRALLARGFVDVTDQVPDLRWAAPGDIIVYEWTPETWENRKKKYQDKHLPNYGHIDIRSYTNYISDFIPATGHPGWTNYTVLGIYRKAYDPEPIWRMKAFLRCLRERECTEVHEDDKRYQLLNSPLPGGTSRTFTDQSTHPWSPFKGTAQFNNKISGAGAYQIQHDTWEDRIKVGAIHCAQGVKRFDRAMQDRVAVAIMESIPLKGNTGDNSALSDIRRGEIESAMSKLRGTWTCLPGAKEDRGFTQADFMKMYQRFYEEAKKGNV